MIAFINPAALPALKIAGAVFITLYLLAGAYVFRKRRRLFSRDRLVPRDSPAVRHLRVEVVLIPWLGISTMTVVLWLSLWFN